MAGISDTRKVQTAVVGTARSRHPVRMPESRHEAVRFRAEHAHRSFWCGTWLGGCGKQLSTRVGRLRIPHFAHYPEITERHVCRRRHTDANSADHLYLSGDLERWLRSQDKSAPEVELRGDFATGGTCHQAVLTTADGRGRISLEFVSGIVEKWSGAWRSRLFAKGQRHPEDLLQRQGYVLRARLGTGKGRYRTEIGTLTRGGPVQWCGLDQCTLTDRGLTTPYMPEPPRPEAERERAAEVFGLPLDTRQILAYPRGPKSTDLAASGSTEHPHRLRVDLAVEKGKPLRFGHLWLPSAVSGVAAGEPHRLVGPAWADLERSVPDQWSVRAAGLVPVRPKPEDVPPTPVPAPPQVPTPAPAPIPEPRAEQPKEPEPGPEPELEPEAAEEQSDLVDPGPVFDTPPLADPLIDWVEEAGWPVRGSRSARRWLALSLMHRSRVYEHRGLANERVQGLHVLDAYGRSWLMVFLMDLFARELVPHDVGDQSSWIARVQKQVIQQLAEWPQVNEHLLLGVGEESDGGRTKPSVRAQVVCQLLGAMALHGRFEAVRTLVERAYRQSEADSGTLRGTDWLTLLDRELGAGTYTSQYTSSGPDHDLRFRATLVDSAGRSASGEEGNCKAEARSLAAQAYAERYLPRALGKSAGQGVNRRAPGSTPLVPRVYRDLPAEQRRVVGRLRSLLALPGSAEGWIVQALTHSSWAYENRSKMLSAAQKDNSLLANHGSFVGQLLHLHHRATRLFGRTLEPTPDEARVSTPETEMWQDMLHGVGAADGLLVSRGTKDPGKAARADAMQALVAVFWREHGTAALGMLPERLVQGFREQRGGLDPVTLLQEFCARFGAGWRLHHRQSGPDHLRSYQAELSLEAAGRLAIVTGPMVAGGKKDASKAVARKALDVIDQLRTAGEWELHEEQIPLARMLLTAQVARAPELTGKKLLACARNGHLGVGFLRDGDLPAFAAWAEQAEAVHGEFSREQLNGLMGLYERAVRSSPAEGPSALRALLGRLAGRAEEVSGGAAAGEEDRQLLLALDQYRRLGSLASIAREPGGEVVLVPGPSGGEDGPRISHGPVGSGEHLGVSPREATCVAVLVVLLCAVNGEASVEAAQDDSGVLVVVTGVGHPLPVAVAVLTELLAEAVPTLALELADGECTLSVTPADRVDSLVQTGAWALRDAFRTPEQLGRVLSLLDVLFGRETEEAEGIGQPGTLDAEQRAELRGKLADMIG